MGGAAPPPPLPTHPDPGISERRGAVGPPVPPFTFHGPEAGTRAEPCTEWCDECQVPLAPSTAHTLTNERSTTVEGMPAGSGISAAYCSEHAPAEALVPAGP